MCQFVSGVWCCTGEEGRGGGRYPVWPDFNITSSLIFPKVAQKVLNWKVPFFKIVLKVTKYLGFFLKKICSQYLSKYAQSGHTDPELVRSPKSTKRLIQTWHSGVWILQWTVVMTQRDRKMPLSALTKSTAESALAWMILKESWRTRIDRISDWPNGFWSTWMYLFEHTKFTPFVKPRRFGQSKIWSIRCLP